MCFGVKDVCAVAFNVGCFARNLHAQVVLRDNFNGIMVFQNGNILVLPHGRHQSALYLEPCVVGMMQNTKVAVSAFAVQIVLSFSVLIKFHTPLHKCFDGVGRIAHNVFHGGQVRNIVACNYRIVDVFFKIVYV